MQYYVPELVKLIEQFERLRGVGNKTANRYAFNILDMDEQSVNEFADALIKAKQNIKHCACCQNITSDELCGICKDSARDRSTICVVEDSKAVFSIENTKEYKGLYHVLHGVISPMDKIGPDKLKIKELLARLTDEENPVSEIIMATNPDIEGEATAMYISKLLKPLRIKVTRLAYGIPVGGDLEYADEVTLLRAMEGRREL